MYMPSGEQTWIWKSILFNRNIINGQDTSHFSYVSLVDSPFARYATETVWSWSSGSAKARASSSLQSLEKPTNLPTSKRERLNLMASYGTI